MPCSSTPDRNSPRAIGAAHSSRSMARGIACRSPRRATSWRSFPSAAIGRRGISRSSRTGSPETRWSRFSRGIAPPILTDRGIAPALAALASRSTVPVQLDIHTEERFPPAVENTIYFVAAESLANVAKHSQAQLCTISLRRVDDKLTLIIGDDGVGGAHVAKGHGLSGLTDRLRAVDGELAVQSPPGGPTVIGAEVPCA